MTSCVANNPAEFNVRLLGMTDEKPVHWRKMRRLAGPDYPRSGELALHAMHDVHKFIVEAFKEWSINTDGEVDVLVEWRGHPDEGEWTWQPLEQLVEDVSVLVAQYVRGEDHQQLTAAHRRAVRQAKKKT